MLSEHLIFDSPLLHIHMLTISEIVHKPLNILILGKSLCALQLCDSGKDIAACEFIL
jgi:hypothetical protein